MIEVETRLVAPTLKLELHWLCAQDQVSATRVVLTI